MDSSQQPPVDELDTATNYTVHIVNVPEGRNESTQCSDCIGDEVTAHASRMDAKRTVNGISMAYDQGLAIVDWNQGTVDFGRRSARVPLDAAVDRVFDDHNQPTAPDIMGLSAEADVGKYCYVIQDSDSGFVQMLCRANSKSAALQKHLGEAIDDLQNEAAADRHLATRTLSEAAYNSALGQDGTDSLTIQYVARADRPDTPMAFTVGAGLLLRAEQVLPYPDNTNGPMRDAADLLVGLPSTTGTPESTEAPIIEAGNNMDYRLDSVVTLIRDALNNSELTQASGVLVQGLLDFGDHINEACDQDVPGSGPAMLSYLCDQADPGHRHADLRAGLSEIAEALPQPDLWDDGAPDASADSLLDFRVS